MVAAASSSRNRGFHHPGPFPTHQVVTALAPAQLAPNAKLIALLMLSQADPQTSILLGKSTPEIAQGASLSRSTVIRMLNLLERTGWMRRTIPDAQQQGQTETTGYQFLIPDSGPPGPRVTPCQEPRVSPVSAGSSCPDQTELFTVVPPSEVLPGTTPVPPSGVRRSTDLSSNSRTSNPREARAAGRQGLELTSTTYIGQAANARTLVAAFVDSYRETWNSTPIDRTIKRVARDAKLLLKEKVEFSLLLDAALEMGTTEYANLGAVAHRLITQREHDARFEGRSWLKVHTVAPYSKQDRSAPAAPKPGSWDARGTWGREIAVAPNWDQAGPSNWDQAVPWHAEDHYDDYDGDSFGNDDEIREAYL